MVMTKEQNCKEAEGQKKGEAGSGPVGGSINYNTVLQLDQFCRK